MISVKLTGHPQLLVRLEKLKRIERIVRLWMESEEVDQIMNDSFSKNFKSQGRPKWASLAEVTKQTRLSKGFGSGPILHQTGNLMDEVTSLKGKVSSFLGGLSKEWGIHQLRSSEKGKFKAHQVGKGKSGQKLSKRPMIGFHQEDAKKLSNSLSNWIFMQIK